MRYLYRIIRFAALLAAIPHALAAQQVTAGAPKAGAFIRVTVDAPVHRRITGRLASLTNDSVVVMVRPTSYLEETREALGWVNVRLLEVERVNRARGAVIGAAFGLVLGVVAGSQMHVEAPVADADAMMQSVAQMVLGGTGAVVGALIGVLAAPSRWERVP